jgi:hypothetical protein
MVSSLHDRDHRTKAVANGALAWYFDGSVAARVSKYHYGINVSAPFQDNTSDHIGRVSWMGRDGTKYVRGRWGLIVAQVLDVIFPVSYAHCTSQGTRVEDGEERYASFSYVYGGEEPVAPAGVALYAYRGKTPPAFVLSKG